MANYLEKMTEADYKTYRRISLETDFSMDKKGKEKRKIKKGALNPLGLMAELILEESILKKEEFIKEIQKKENQMYFFKNSKGEVIGMLILSFSDRKCEIHELVVTESGKGLGTELYNLALERMKANATKTVELWCPFPGAQEFWKKNGFFSKI